MKQKTTNSGRQAHKDWNWRRYRPRRRWLPSLPADTNDQTCQGLGDDKGPQWSSSSEFHLRVPQGKKGKKTWRIFVELKSTFHVCLFILLEWQVQVLTRWRIHAHTELRVLEFIYLTSSLEPFSMFELGGFGGLLRPRVSRPLEVIVMRPFPTWEESSEGRAVKESGSVSESAEYQCSSWPRLGNGNIQLDIQPPDPHLRRAYRAYTEPTCYA